MLRLPALRVAACVLVLFAAACGDDDSGSGPAGPEAAPDAPGPDTPAEPGTPADPGNSVEVVALDIDFDRDAYEAEAGEVDLRYVNEGNLYHTLVIEDVGGLELTVRSAGDVDEGSVDLDPGEYVLYCDVPGHRQAGMVADLTVS